MFSIPTRFHVIFLIQVVLCIGAVLMLSWYFSVKERQLVVHIDEQVESVRGGLLEAAGVADRGEAGERADTIIVDCTSRNQFEDLLGRLHLLPRADLERASSLFEACGDYFATRKGMGVLLLQEELDSFEGAVTLRHQVTKDDPYTDVVLLWGRIVDLELKRAGLLREQVALQRDIIAELLAQGSIVTINERMARAGQVVELFAVYDKQIDALRIDESKLWADIRK